MFGFRGGVRENYSRGFRVRSEIMVGLVRWKDFAQVMRFAMVESLSGRSDAV